MPRQSIRMLSIGTGRTKSGMTIPHSPLFRRGADNYGILGWLLPTRVGETPSYPLLNMLFDAGSAASELLATQVLGTAFHRVQIQLEKSIGLDDIGALDALKSTAEQFIALEGLAPGPRVGRGEFRVIGPRDRTMRPPRQSPRLTCTRAKRNRGEERTRRGGLKS